MKNEKIKLQENLVGKTVILPEKSELLRLYDSDTPRGEIYDGLFDTEGEKATVVDVQEHEIVDMLVAKVKFAEANIKDVYSYVPVNALEICS